MMTKDEIIQMVLSVVPELDKAEAQGGGDTLWLTYQELQRFAALVAEKEREACAKVCDDMPAPARMSLDNEALYELATLDCADAIRARGKQT